MAKTTGTLTQPFRIVVNIDELNDKITELVKEALEQAIDDMVENSESVVDRADNDGSDITLEGTYETGYTRTTYAGSRLDPPEDDIERQIDELDKDTLETNLCHYLSITKKLDLSDCVSITSVHEDCEADLGEPDGPDPDMMPGGHDYY